MKTLDMKGHPCPIPVVEAKKCLADQGTAGVVVLVDNMAAVQNLQKMANGFNYNFLYEETGGVFKVIIAKTANSGQVVEEPFAAGVPKDEGRGPVVLISTDNMGAGEKELGKLLIKGFIYSLTQLNPPPEAVIFLSSGAFLTTEGANTVPDLKELEKRGAKVFTCGTCANYYKLTESLAAGSIVDMMTIVNHLAKASNIITI
ncbi:MAG: sulfurtransferase-like selenium metabolism protein YedF [Treponema sp.]|nr:sulfurtransferase-like selenium metabolism protein YedF [Treponema sp.]